MVNRFDIYLINLDQDPSKDPKNTRPGVVLSPDEMNRNIKSVIIAPLSSTAVKFPTRVPIDFLNGERFIVLDQIRTVDKIRLVKKIGVVDRKSQTATVERLQEMFAE